MNKVQIKLIVFLAFKNGQLAEETQKYSLNSSLVLFVQSWSTILEKVQRRASKHALGSKGKDMSYEE